MVDTSLMEVEKTGSLSPEIYIFLVVLLEISPITILL